MKRSLPFLLSLVLLFSFCGCNKKEVSSSLSNISSDLGFFSSIEQTLSENGSAISSEILVSESSSKQDVIKTSSAISKESSIPNISSSKESSKTNTGNTAVLKPQIINYDNVKAIWLSQFDLNPIYVERDRQRNKADFENKISEVLSNVKKNGFNTILVQVRPYADSFYPSLIYPASSLVVGKYGGTFSYDPFRIILEKAHSIDLSVHAWINPMRAMKESEIVNVSNIYKIKKWYNEKSKCIVNLEGRFFINPAEKEARSLIVAGVSEILRLYDVDGVHMDDYFYPTTAESFDSESYAEYKKNGGELTLAEFRRAALDKLVAEIYKTVKTKNKELIFGISPEGNMENVYNNHYANIFKWCSKSGYIDYICPQIYFGFEHEFLPFDETSKQWEDIIENENVKLMIGMSLGKAKEKIDYYAGTGRDEWSKSTDILKRCLESTKDLSKCSGVSYYCYQYFYSPLTNNSVAQTQSERDNLIPVLKNIKWK